MAVLTVLQPTVAGVAPSYVSAAAGGDTFSPGTTGPVVVHVKNGSGSPITVTVDDPTSPSPAGASSFNPDVAVSVPATGERIILLNPVTRFVDPATGLVSLSYSGVTSLTLTVYRVV